MTYQEATEYLFNVAPLFQNIGAGAYKEGLSNTLTLDDHFGNPHRSYHVIHVAGTNGKGSCSHTLASILQCAGYKVGLYTSPHLVDFRERIRVNGEPIPEQRVIDFVENERSFFTPLYPSFFELTTSLAFTYFREQNVDVAVVEVGLGGRLDCTNIVTPDLSVITNISFDHVQFLGDTLPKIATEKAGIIKKNVPVVVGETGNNAEVREVFASKAKAEDSEIIFADEQDDIVSFVSCKDGGALIETKKFGEIHGELGGFCQKKNAQTILCAVDQLRKNPFYKIQDKDVVEGFQSVCSRTGLMGRWQKIAVNPTVICDTAHNPGGIQYVSQQLEAQECHTMRIVYGMVGDKDIRSSLGMMPRNAKYYFAKSSVKRAMDADKIASLAQEFGIEAAGIFESVMEAYSCALVDAQPDDFIFVGGSSFVVADLLSGLKNKF